MIAYVDSSVVLRIVLGQREQLAEWNQIVRGVTSALLEVECLRTMDRLRASAKLTLEESVAKREDIFRVLEALEVVDISRAVLHRAADSRPTPLGTLDAIHLATADLWREGNATELVLATHDRALALAARASGFRVVGVS